MTPERYQQIEQLYHRALELDASQRAAFLDRACGGDAALRRALKSLLAAHAQEWSLVSAKLPSFSHRAHNF